MKLGYGHRVVLTGTAAGMLAVASVVAPPAIGAALGTVGTAAALSRGCVSESLVIGAIRQKYLQKKAGLGCPLTAEIHHRSGVRYTLFAGGGIFWHPSNPRGEAFELRGSIFARYWANFEGNVGDIGWPVTDESTTPVRYGKYNHFSHGASIYWSPATPASIVKGRIRQRWAVTGWESGRFGFPTKDETFLRIEKNGRVRTPLPPGDYAEAIFQCGSMYYNFRTGEIISTPLRCRWV